MLDSWTPLPAATGCVQSRAVTGQRPAAVSDKVVRKIVWIARELIDVFWDSLNLAGLMLPPTNTMPATRHAHDLIADCVIGHDPQASREAMWDHFAAWLTIMSIIKVMKSKIMTSTTGRIPVIADPTPAAAMAPSEIGVSRTRASP